MDNDQTQQQPDAREERKPLSECVQVDDLADTITIHGVRYSGALFASLGLGPIGQTFVIVSRHDGVVTLENRGA